MRVRHFGVWGPDWGRATNSYELLVAEESGSRGLMLFHHKGMRVAV